MCLKPTQICPVPPQTARIAAAAFPKNNLCIQMRDQLGTIYEDQQFCELFPAKGQPAEAPWRLALVTVLQFIENLTDRQAAEAVRGRIDWKYLLGLELEDSGFDASVLSEFRTRLVAGSRETLLLDVILSHFKTLGFIKPRGKQRSDSTHVLAAVRAINRMLTAGETLRKALNDLALVAPDWLNRQVSEQWFTRYGRRIEESRLPKEKVAREEWAEKVGADGWQLLQAIYHDCEVTQPNQRGEGAWLSHLPAVKVLRQVWLQQFEIREGELKWRHTDNIAPAYLLINSPYDVEAHYAKKNLTQWVGYKVHLTEQCEEDKPNLITNVETGLASVSDHETTPVIHEHLKLNEVLPALHIVDTGYTEAKLLVSSLKNYQVELLGPSRPNVHWQNSKFSEYANSYFTIDWDGQTARCPQGKLSSSWSPATTRSGRGVIKIRFSQKDCKECPVHTLCTDQRRRLLTVESSEEYIALQQARIQEKTAEFKQIYAQRAGVEGTISAGVRAHDLRRSRYRGMGKTHLQHVASGAAINVIRVIDWLEGKERERTRTSHFAALAHTA
ncbi:MAG TPA: IS1182 family transposase [Chloroflexia bacterium]|nr:IS1182 family transposase [Chloroflexia bacterium]